ncbi:hypothetical protein RQP46_005718 [Phenoliferia psychrophenolica]
MPRTVQISPELTVPTPGYGAMGLSQSYGPADREASKDVLRHAIKIGCTFWNTATVYGVDSHNEKLIGEVLREGDNRSKVIITTKWGLRRVGTDSEVVGTAAFAKECIDKSIVNLGSAPDIWLLHRIDKNTPVEESVKAMQEAREAGKCKFIGLSSMSAKTLRRAATVAKIDFVEMEVSPWHVVDETNGVFDACRELGVKVISYSPLGRGFLTGRFRKFEDVTKEGDSRSSGAFPRFDKENFDRNFKIVEAFESLAATKGCTPGQLCLAWATSVHGDLIIPIPGTKSIKYLDENFASREVSLSVADHAAIRKIIQENAPIGDQYSGIYAKMMDSDV